MLLASQFSPKYCEINIMSKGVNGSNSRLVATLQWVFIGSHFHKLNYSVVGKYNVFNYQQLTSQLSGTKNSLLGFASLHILANNF